MPIECYLRHCPHHDKQEPFCGGDECIASEKQLQLYNRYREYEFAYGRIVKFKLEYYPTNLKSKYIVRPILIYRENLPNNQVEYIDLSEPDTYQIKSISASVIFETRREAWNKAEQRCRLKLEELNQELTRVIAKQTD